LRTVLPVPLSSSNVLQGTCRPFAKHADEAAGNSIRDIVVAAWSVIDAIAAAAARAPLQTAELRD
jgi:hypothetical protein